MFDLGSKLEFGFEFEIVFDSEFEFRGWISICFQIRFLILRTNVLWNQTWSGIWTWTWKLILIRIWIWICNWLSSQIQLGIVSCQLSTVMWHLKCVVGYLQHVVYHLSLVISKLQPSNLTEFWHYLYDTIESRKWQHNFIIWISSFSSMIFWWVVKLYESWVNFFYLDLDDNYIFCE